MKYNTFEEQEIPYKTLAKFGLSHEMIEDLPMFALEDICNGRPSPILPISLHNEENSTIKSRSRFALVRIDGKVDVMFYPLLKFSPLESFDAKQQELLKEGKAIIADTLSPEGKQIKAFVQIDSETNQVMAVPSPIIGRNLQVISDELSLSSAEINILQNGEALTFIVEDAPITVGIDLKANSGFRISDGDNRQWKEQGKREWDKYTFGCYGCWVMNNEGYPDYVAEESYTEELWNEQKRSAERNAAVHQRK